MTPALLLCHAPFGKNPEAVRDYAAAHASAWVQDGRGSVVDFLKSIPTPILAGLLYFTERDDSHFAPAGVADVSGALDGLREAGCDFWVLELHTRETLEQTRRVVDECLTSQKRPVTENR